MSELTLVRGDVTLDGQQKEVLRLSLFGMIDGLSRDDQRAWRRFWKRIVHAGTGEIFSVDTWTPRHGGFHRRHMLIETRIFQEQERIANFEMLRAWLKIGAGFCDWMAGPKGGVVPVPKSISYRKCDEDEMRKFHDSMIGFLRGPHACRYLWPMLDAAQAEAKIESILSEFNE